MARAIAAEFGYNGGVGAMVDSMILVPNLVHNLGPFCFAHTYSMGPVLAHFRPNEAQATYIGKSKSPPWLFVLTGGTKFGVDGPPGGVRGAGVV